MGLDLGTLQEMLDREECQERWENLPAADREEAVEALAEILLQVVEGEHEVPAEDSPEAP